MTKPSSESLRLFGNAFDLTPISGDSMRQLTNQVESELFTAIMDSIYDKMPASTLYYDDAVGD